MKAPARLGLYGAGLAAVFAVAFATAGAVVPAETVQAWATSTDTHAHDGMDGHDANGQAAHAGHDSKAQTGLGEEQDGYTLAELTGPLKTGVPGRLSLAITGPDREAVTDFELDHQKKLHLIVVRADGQEFNHVHPVMNAQGMWSIPWSWNTAGTYRVFADFVPAETGEGITISTTLHISGDFEPVSPEPSTTTTVDGYDVAVTGALTAGDSSTLTMSVTRGGKPVTDLEPYLGAFGHLVALRAGDLAYLHVHPHGGTPRAGQTSGPEIEFEATAPTAGRYLLFLDFKTNGQVHTAPLVIDTGGSTDDTTKSSGDSQDHDGEGQDHDH